MNVRGLLAVTAVLLSPFLAGGCGKRSHRPSSPPVNRLITRGEVLEIFPEISPDGSRAVYSSLVGESLEILARNLADTKEPVQLTADGAQNVHPTWSPDGTEIAYHSKDHGGIWKIPSAGGKPRVLADFGSSPAWSRDGREVVFQSVPMMDILATSPPAVPPSTIWIVPANGGPARGVTKEGEPAGGHGSPFWSKDGKRIYFVASDPRALAAELWSVKPDGSDLHKTLSASRVFDPTLSPNTNEIFFGGDSPDGRHAILRVALESDGTLRGTPEVVTTPGFSFARHPSISLDGKRLLWASLATNGNLWSLPMDPVALEQAGPVRRLSSGEGRHTWPVFSPDGRRIAFGTTLPGRGADVWVMNADGTGLLQLTSDPAVDQIQDWFPDNRRVIFGSMRGRGYSLWWVDTTNRKEEKLPFTLKDAEVPRFSPDGQKVAYHSKRGGVTLNTWLYDIKTGKDTQLTFDREFLGYPIWSPDGKWLCSQVRRGEDVHIVVLDPNGGEPQQLTFDRGLQWSFSYSPDGSQIVYAGLSKDCWNLYAVSVATKKITQLTENQRRLDIYFRYPAWSPDGKQIVYEYAETKSSVWLLEGLD